MSFSPVETAFIMSDQSKEIEQIKARLVIRAPRTRIGTKAHTTGESPLMATTSNYLALDLGAESGRGLLGRFDGRRLVLEEVHRFPNSPVRMMDTLYWDLPRLFDEIKMAAAAEGAAQCGELDGIGIDTWGVDFGLIGRGETLLGNPVHYRDARTDGMLEVAFALGPAARGCMRSPACSSCHSTPCNNSWPWRVRVRRF